MEVDGDDLDSDDLYAIVRQKPNLRSFGFKFKLLAFNMVDSTRVANKRFRKNMSLRKKNAKRKQKEERINAKRIAKAKKKGKNAYVNRSVALKDTVNPKKFFREWFKYKFGEQPVVFDSLLFNKTDEQLGLYLVSKGYYYGDVKSEVTYKRRRKAVAKYSIVTGQPYLIDSVYFRTHNRDVELMYNKFVKKQDHPSLIGQKLDKDILEDYRTQVARSMRDNALYGFSSSHITYEVDTTLGNMKATVGVIFGDRMVRADQNKDSLIARPHRTTYVKNVYFHIADTTYFEGSFKDKVEELGLNLMDGQFVNAIDTFVYAEIKKKDGSLNPFRVATFLYNGKLSIDPGLLEAQNYLEKDNYYKEYYLERSYTRLLQLGLFQAIKPVIKEIPGTNFIEVHYYLVPSKKQNFSFEPRFTTSNGFLGVASSINYTNKNLFGGGEKMTFSIGGGFESQPNVIQDGSSSSNQGRSFNTFEIGPSLKFDLPGLFPSKVTSLGKRQRPRTELSTALNYQNRDDFERYVFQFNYLYKFYVSKTQIFQMGLPFLSVVKFVLIDKSQDFQDRIDALNDVFLENAYSNQFVWQDFKLKLDYNNKDKDDRTSKNLVLFNANFDLAGNTLSMFKGSLDTLENGQRSIFGVAYSQFARVDNDFIFSRPLNRKMSIHSRLLSGIGLPYGNTTTSMPYDYGFFAGGSNDNRGWRARSMAPGIYKSYVDTNAANTQIGDIKLAATFEYRFNMGTNFKGAFFADAGNIWTINEDENRSGSKFTGNWYKEIKLASGFGLRYDFEFFVFRFDVGIPIYNPAYQSGAKWIFEDRGNRETYYREGMEVYGQKAIDMYMSDNPTLTTPPDFNDSWKYIKQYKLMPMPFKPVFHFGIGYPF